MNNQWVKFKETSQILSVLMLDSLAMGMSRYFTLMHDNKTKIKRYGQFLGGRLMGENDIKNYEQMMAEASPAELLKWSGEYRRRKILLRDFSLKIFRIKFKQYPDEYLLKLFKKYCNLCIQSYNFVYDYVILNKLYSEKINKLLLVKDKNINSLNSCLPYIAGLDTPTDIHTAPKKLGETAILAKMKGFNDQTARMVKKYCQRYGYLEMFTYFGAPLMIAETIKRIKSLMRKSNKEIVKDFVECFC